MAEQKNHHGELDDVRFERFKPKKKEKKWREDDRDIRKDRRNKKREFLNDDGA